MPDELARALDFLLRADLAGTRSAPMRWGKAVFLPECPLRHDSNYLLVRALPPDVDAAALAAEAERVQGEAGLTHRAVLVTDAARGESLAKGFEALGWTAFRAAVMAYRGPSTRPFKTDAVVPTDAASLRAARVEQILGYPWGTPEVARQLMEAHVYLPVEARCFAVFLDGEPVSWCDLYVEDNVAQVEAVATVERHRNRGHTSAVVLRAVAEAREAGARLLFLVADADDWPRHLYHRLGFREIGRFVKFARSGGAATGATS